MYDTPKTDGTHPRAVNCLLIAFEQAARMHGIDAYESFKRAARKHKLDDRAPDVYEHCPFAKVRESIANLITSQLPDQSSYKLHASLLTDEDGFPNEEAALLHSMMLDQSEYLRRAKQYLSVAQQEGLERLPTTISDRLELAIKMFDSAEERQALKSMTFATKARHLEHVMGFLDEEQRAKVEAFNPPSADRRLEEAGKHLSASQREEVYRLEPIDESIKSLVRADIQNEMLTWEIFHVWVKKFYPSVNVVPCLHMEGNMYQCGNYDSLDPANPFVFIERNGNHFQALIPIGSTNNLHEELCIIEGWRMTGTREISIDGVMVRIYLSKLDEETAVLHIQPQNIMRLMPPRCEFITTICRLPRCCVAQFHRYDQEICDNLHVSSATDGFLDKLTQAAFETSLE